MKLKKYGIIFLLVAALAVLAVAIPALAAAETVVYLDQTGATADSVTTMEAAFAALPDGGTIKLVGTYEFTDATVTFPASNGKVTITGSDSAAKLHFNTTAKGRVIFQSPVELNNLTYCYSHSSGNNMDVYAGPELIIGENVTAACDSHTTFSSSCIAFRGGNYKSVCDTSKLTVNSGTWSYINAAHNYGVTNSYITIGGNASLLSRLQCGGTAAGADIGNSTVVVNTTGSLNRLDLNGYATAHTTGTAKVTVTRGTIPTISTRSATSILKGDVTLEIGANADIGSISLQAAQVDTAKTFTLSIADDMAKEMVLTDAFGTGWDTITVGKNNTITVNSAASYAGLTVGSGSTIYLLGDETLPAEYSGEGQVVPMKGVYVHEHDGSNYHMSELITMSAVTGSGLQGTAVYGDWLFQSDKYGQISVFNLAADDPGAQVANFYAGCYNTGTLPSGDAATGTSAGHWANHNNQMMFGSAKFADSDPFPLLYITTGNSGNHDGTGAYISKCSVERISYDAATNTWGCKTVQIIEFNDVACIPDVEGNANKNMNGDNGTSELVSMFNKETGKFQYLDDPATTFDESQYEKVGWGWAASFVDGDPTGDTAGKFYLKGARFRTTAAYELLNPDIYGIDNYYEDNAYIVTEFDLPALPASEDDPAYGGIVTLYPADITGQFTLDYDVHFTQGGSLYQGRIYYSYGNQSKDEYTRNFIQIIDIAEERIAAQLNLTTSVMSAQEPECTAFYNGKLVLSTNARKIYQFDMFMIDVEAREATATEPATVAHAICSYCGKTYDLDYKTELTSIEVPTAAAEEGVIYVKDGGTGDGATPDTAMGDLFAAIEALPADGGTVVVCGDLTVTGVIKNHVWTWTAKTGKITVNGMYNGTDYAPTITFKGTKNIIEGASEIEFDNVTLDHQASGGSTEFYCGPSVTIGHNVTFLAGGSEIPAGYNNNNGAICFRMGKFNYDCADSYLEINSGTFSYIQGGNNKKAVTNSTIVVNPGVTVTDFIQVGATQKSVGTADVTINGADVAYVYLGGYSDTAASTLGSVKLNVKNTNVTAIYGERAKDKFQQVGTTGTISGDLNVTLDNVTVDTWDLTGLTVGGSQNLTVKNATDMTVANTLSGWDSLNLENATVLVDAVYAGPASVTADADSLLILSDDNTSLPTVTEDRVALESKAVVYLDGTNIADMAAAYAKLAENGVKGGIIVLTKDLTMTYSGQNDWPTANGPVTVTSQNGAVLTLTNNSGGATQVHFRSNTKFSNINLNQTNTSAENRAVELWVPSKLTFGEGVVCTINGTTNIADTTGLYSNGRLCVRIGDLDADNASGTFVMHSGALSFVHGGNNQKTVTSANIYVGAGATVADFIQCGGTKRAVASSNVVIDGGDVYAVYLGGYGSAQTTTVNFTANNADITYLYGQRDTTTVSVGNTVGTITGDLNVTLDHATVGTVDLSKLTVSGNADLTLKNQDVLTVGSGLSYWDSLTLQNAVVYLKGNAYAGPATVTADGDSAILVDTEAYPDALPTIETVRVAYYQSVPVAGEPDPEPSEPETSVPETSVPETTAPAPTYLDVVYLSGSGSDSNDGTTAVNAVATFEKAYELVKEGGTIILCGDISITVTDNYYLPEKAVTITGDIYNPVWTVETSKNAKAHVQFTAATTLKNLTVNRGATLAGYPRCLELWTGPSLTLGEGMKMTNNGASLSYHPDGQVSIRTGHRIQALNAAALTMQSGTVSFIQGGNNANAVGTSTITLKGTAVVQDMLQCGGTNKAVTASVVNISGDVNIDKLYVNGYGSANLGTSDITITGGTINSIAATRPDATGKISGNINMTIGGSANVRSISLLDADITMEGTNTLVFQDNMTTELSLSAGFGDGWDSVTVGDNTVIRLMGAYANGGALNMEDGSILYLNSDGGVNTEVPPYNKTGTAQTGLVVLEDMHNIIHVAAKDAGVYSDGCKEHYQCTACGTCYADANGETVLDYETQIRIPATGIPEYHEYVDGSNFSLSTIFSGGGSQGIAVSGDLLFKASNRGTCTVFDLTTGKQVGSFDFGSVTESGSGASANHSNSIMFSDIYYAENDPFPLLVVCAGNSGDHISDGSIWGEDTVGSYYGHMAVERIFYDETTGKYSAETVVRVFFNDTANIPIGEGDSIDARLLEMYDSDTGSFPYVSGNGYDAANGYQKVGWGWPAWFIDSDPTETTENKLYLYSARYRTYSSYEDTNRGYYGEYGFTNYQEDNAYIVTEFDLEGLIPTATENTENYGKNVILYPKDITDQFTTEYENGGTQGGTLYQGRIYYSYGFGTAGTNYHARNFLQVFDIAQKKIVSKVPLYNDPTTHTYEPECPAIWNGELIISMNPGVYLLGYVALDEPTVVEPTEEAGGITFIECALCGHNLKTLATSDPLPEPTTEPETTVPETSTEPETTVPETSTEPETTVPETSTEPETTVPETSTEPETTVPETSTEPETTVPETSIEPETSVPEETKPEETEPETVIVYVKVPEGWENPGLWAWDDAGKNAFDAWPGIALTEGKDGWWYASVPAWVENIIVNANGGTVQTGDLDLAVTGENVYVEVSLSADGKVEVEVEYDAPDTGDDFEALPFILLMLLSAAGVIVLIVGRKQWFRRKK